MSAIVAENLIRTFRVPERDPGLRNAVRSVVRRKWREVEAVKGVSFVIEPGEIVGFLGPNGAGKTTTLKMLTGLVQPTSGTARVLGFDATRRQPAYLARIALTMGNRNQLSWDLPASDTFELLRVIYDVPLPDFRKTLATLTELLELGDVMRKPVRNLSLGERMKCELAASIIHSPDVMFMDEPTLGLDVNAQRLIREFLLEHNKRTGCTILLTSHYMADIEALCKRVIVIDRGEILFDGNLADLATRINAGKVISLTFQHQVPAGLGDHGKVIDVTGSVATIEVSALDAAEVAGRMLTEFDVHDLTVTDPPLEQVIETVFAKAKTTTGSSQ